MKFGLRALGALVATLIAALPAAAPAQVATHSVEELQAGIGEVEPHADGYRHRASGYIFPRTLDVVPARKSTTYSAGDADMQYTLYGGGNGDGWINLFIYPASISLTEEVANVTQSLVKNTSGRPITPPAAMGKPSAGVEEGWFEGSIQGIALVTAYRVSRVGNWFIKARISIPASADQATFNRMGAALNAIDFAPANLAPPSSPPTKDPVT